MSVLCGECAEGGGGALGCLKELSVTALRTSVTITASGEQNKLPHIFICTSTSLLCFDISINSCQDYSSEVLQLLITK